MSPRGWGRGGVGRGVPAPLGSPAGAAVIAPRTLEGPPQASAASAELKGRRAGASLTKGPRVPRGNKGFRARRPAGVQPQR